MSDGGLAGGLTPEAGPSIAGPGAVSRADALALTAASGRWWRWAAFAGVLFLVLSVVRQVTDNPQLTSFGTFGLTLRFAVPILLAALGGLYAERCGVVNIGLEGMMILGTWFGAWGAWQYGPWWGVAIGIAGGAAGGLLHAIATVTFGVDHIISGVAIITLAGGIARYLSSEVYDGVQGGGATQSPRVTSAGTFDVPWVSDRLQDLEEHHWLVLSDVAGFLRAFTENLAWLTLIALLLVPLTWFILWRTVFGLRLRSCGEHPTAADTLGVSVYRMKYAGVLISGGLAGLAGAFLAIEASGIYRQGQTQGRGFIGLAALIFGNWRPGGAAGGALLFGFADALQLRESTAVHAALLFVSVITVIGAVYLVVKGRRTGAVIAGTLGILVGIWYFTSDEIPVEFVKMTPYVVTLVVLAVATQRLRPPAYVGRPWRKGQVE
jgi:simple sugar transport system permease protein